MATDDYPSRKIIISEQDSITGNQLMNYVGGFSNHRKPIYCVINPVSGDYSELRAIGSEPVQYKASFKIRINDNSYKQYTDQIVIWNSVYITADKVKESMINLGIERDGFVITKIS